jgi:tRNA(fMet)-specific endonuclease VapC
VYVPIIVLGELYFGASNSERVAENVARLTEWKRDTVILLCTEGTAEEYGRIKARLSRAGRPLPDNDLWIAAISMERQLPLLTRDSHFEAIAGLALLAIE